MARKRGKKNIVLVEGILTFWDEDKLDGVFYRKIFITAGYQVLKDRREGRAYLMSDGEEWKDPPHYFEKIAWPRYIQYNQELLQTTENSDVLRLYSDQQSLYEMLEAAVDIIL